MRELNAEDMLFCLEEEGECEQHESDFYEESHEFQHRQQQIQKNVAIPSKRFARISRNTIGHHISGQLQKTLQPKKRRKKKLIQLSSRGDTNSEKAARVAAASVS